MRKVLPSIALGTLIVVLAGCPFFLPRKYDFTSADLLGNRGLFDFATALEGAPGGDAEAVPEREVVEPDVIRRNENLLYILNQFRGLTLVDLDSQLILAQVPTYGYPRDLYVVGNRAYVLVAFASDYEADGDTVHYDIQSRLYIVDITNPEQAAVINSYDLEGDLVDSRLVGTVLYAVGAEYEWYWLEGGVVGQVVKAQTSASWVTSVNVADENNIFQADQVSFDGIGNVIHATPSAIFVAASDWQTDSTLITYVDINDLGGQMTVRDSVNVTGQVADKFKLDVWNGVLRVVSSAWTDERRIYITTVDLADANNLKVMAESEFERARGDSLFATRFDGPRAYVVTYFVVDPLFVVDLSDPSDPAFVGELEVPGWSTYIEPMGDLLVTLGVDDTDGRRVSVSLFDVANPASPSLVDRVSFGQSWSWSSAYSDVKALTVLSDVIIVPFSGWEDAFGGFDRLQFISYAPDDLAKRGNLDVQGTILRSFEYGDAYYGVTSEQLAKIDGTDLDAPQVVNSLVLAENVADFVELSPALGVEVVTRYDTGETIVRRRDLPLKDVAGEAHLEIGELVDTYAHGSSVVLVGATWYEDPAYKVAIVDFTEPSAPVVAHVIDVNVQPYYGYWWYGPYLPLVDAVATDALIAPWPPFYPQGSSLLVNDTLVLRCATDVYDDVIGTEAPYQGLAFVDLTQPAWTSTIGLGFEQVVSVNGKAGKVYIASKVSLNPTLLEGDPMCAYFVTPFDPVTESAGPTVNVPGMYVQYDPTTQVLTLRDDQWGRGYDYASELNTVSWNGGAAVSPLDSEQLPDGSANVLGRGAKVYVDTYDQGTLLYAATIGGNGAIALGNGVLVTDGWANLIDGHGTSAYLSVGGGAVVRYDCSANPKLKEIVEVMGSPSRIRFGSSAAYAPLGYFGIVSLGL